MMNELGVSQHNMCSCSVTAAGDILFVCTSNGVDESHINLPAPGAPSFLALDKNTGKILWKNGAPGNNILHGQWSSPAYAVIDGVPQVIFAGGDGWLYSFRGDTGKDGAHLPGDRSTRGDRSRHALRGHAGRVHRAGDAARGDVYDGSALPEHGLSAPRSPRDRAAQGAHRAGRRRRYLG
jgi:hypothetical protein